MKELPCPWLKYKGCTSKRWFHLIQKTVFFQGLCWRLKNGPLFFFPSQQAVCLLVSCKLELRVTLFLHVSTVGLAQCDSVLCLGATAWQQRGLWVQVGEAPLPLILFLFGEGKWAEISNNGGKKTCSGGVPQIIEWMGNTGSCGRTKTRVRAATSLAVMTPTH